MRAADRGLSGERPRPVRGNDKLDLAVIHLTFEGIQTFGGGVATVTRGHLGAMPRLKEELAREGVSLTPYFAEIAYAKGHARRDPQFQKHAEEQIARMGGRFEYLVNFTQGYLPSAPWGVADIGDIENWKACSASGAAVALNIARGHQVAVAYCHDSLFALAPIYATLQSDAVGVDLTAIYVIHATALTHELPLPNPQRLMVESASIHWAKVTPKAKLGYISKFMSHHIVEDYGARPESLVPTGNGINPTDPFFRLRDRNQIVDKLRQYNIPTDRPLVFSWGRSVAYKKYDIVLEAAAKLKGKVHPVITVSPEYPELVELAKRLGLDASLIFAFDPELVACVLQWEKTIAAASLAYREPFGLTPIEIRMHGRRRGALVVVSDTGGLVEQVRDGVDGFVTKQDDPDDVARVFQHILNMSEAQKDNIRKAGLQTVLDRYTWSSQILTTLSAVLPEMAESAGKVRNRLSRETLAELR